MILHTLSGIKWYLARSYKCKAKALISNLVRGKSPKTPC